MGGGGDESGESDKKGERFWKIEGRERFWRNQVLKDYRKK